MTVNHNPTTPEWIRDYLKLCGDKDIDGAMEHWAPEGFLRFANEEPLIGREVIRETFKGFVGNWTKETHRVVELWEVPEYDLIILELEVTFERRDGHEVSVNGCTICRVKDDQFLEQRTTVDMSPVFAPLETASA